MISESMWTGPRLPFCYRVDDAFSEGPEPAGNTALDGLRALLDRLAFHRHGTLFATPLSPDEQGRVLLFALSPGTVLVIGVSSLACRVRELLGGPEGVLGWHLHPLPDSRTPLHRLREHLRPQQYNVLDRNEFATVEEVAAVPWELWEQLRNVGTSFLRTLETALAAVPAGPRESPSANCRSSADEQGWFLQVSADGRSATVRAPDAVTLTELSGAKLQLSTTGDPNEAQPVEREQPQPLEWTSEMAEQILRRARPAGSTFLRALIDEGGTATAERLRERTDIPALHHATQSLSTAAKYVLSRHHPDGRSYRHFVTARSHPNEPRGRVYDYHLPDELLGPFEQALTRLGY